MSNAALVEDFIRQWEAKSIDGILQRMTPDVRYANVGMSEAIGHDAVREGLAPFLGMSSRIEWTVHHIAETADGVVLTERTDVFEIGDKTISVPVMGVFELKGGLICGWRDYFDLPGFQAQMA